MRSTIVVKEFITKDKDLIAFLQDRAKEGVDYIFLPEIRKILFQEGFDFDKFIDGYYWLPKEEWHFQQWDQDESFLIK